MAIGTPTFGNGGGASAAASFNVSFPSGIGEGDLLILACYTRSNNASAFSRPASFTGTITGVTATANGSYAVYYKIATGTESGTLSVTGSTSNNTEVAKIVCIPGGGDSFTAGSAETEAAGTTFTNSGVTPATNGSMVVLVTGFQDHGTTTGDTGFSNWTGGTGLGTWSGSAYGTTSGTDGTIGIGCALQSTAQATGNISVDHTSETNNAGISYSFAVAPGAYRRTESESVTATDSYPVGKVLRGVDQSEPATATDVLGVGKVLVAQGVTESVTATDALDSSKTSPATSLAIESGFPVSTNITSARATVTATVTTASASVLVVVIGGVSADSNAFPLASMEGASLTWTKVTGASSNQLSGSEGHEVWYAVSSGSISSQVITATVGGSRTIYTGIMSVYSFTGADTTTVIGGSGTNIYNASSTANTTLTATAASNIVALINWRKDSSTALTAETFNSPYDATYQDLGNAAWFGSGHGDTTAPGSQTFGSSTTSTRGGVGGVEVLAGAGESSPYTRTQSESATATDTLDVGRVVRTQEQTESATATDTLVVGKVLRGVDQSESATATDSIVVGKILRGVDQSESATATDVLAVGKAVRGVDEVESATATDVLAAGRTLRTEEQAETVTATDDYLSAKIAGGTVYDFDQSESATATDILDVTRLVRPQSQTEAATATDSFQAYAGWYAGSQTESVTATETWDFSVLSAGVYSEGQSESATATDEVGAWQGFSCARVEIATASDSYAFAVVSPATTYNEGQVESATASDLYNGTTIAIIQQRLRLWNGSSWV